MQILSTLLRVLNGNKIVMPLERIIVKSENEKVAIWHLTESLDELSQLINLSDQDQETLK